MSSPSVWRRPSPFLYGSSKFLLQEEKSSGCTPATFVKFLSNSINSLEGGPLSATHEFRRHEYAAETEGYLNAEGYESRQDLAQERLLSWIHELKRTYGKYASNLPCDIKVQGPLWVGCGRLLGLQPAKTQNPSIKLQGGPTGAAQ